MALYDSIADTYARYVDTAPYNVLYERPAMLTLLPDVVGCHVLDVGCGSGWYAAQLLERGAHVTGFDASAAMVAYARARVHDRAELCVADLAQPLTFVADASMDVVIAPLVLHYLRDWTHPLAEFRRVLRPGGCFLFSTHHPGSEAERLETPRYFETELIEETWPHVGTVQFYRRPLSAIFDALRVAGFTLDRVAEPQPSDALRAADPAAYDRLTRRPAFLLIRAYVSP